MQLDRPHKLLDFDASQLAAGEVRRIRKMRHEMLGGDTTLLWNLFWREQ
jgi:hypothetical protein